MWPTFHIEGAATVEGDDILAYGVCKTSTAADHEITLTPATNLPGIRDGDYLVVWLYCGRATANRYCFTPLSGWTVISGRSNRADGSIANYLCVGRFYNAATDSAFTWAHERSVDTTICLQAFAYRNISRRYPVDQVQGVITAGNISHTLPDHQTLWGRQRRIHHSSAIVGQALMYRSSTVGEMLPLTAAAYLGGGTLDVGAYGFASNMHLDCFHERVVSNGLRNDLTNVPMQGGEIGLGGFTAHQVQTVASDSGSLRSDLIEVAGNNVSQHHYLSRTVSLSAGQQGFFLARLGGYTSASTDHRWAVCVVRPDGIIVGQMFTTNQSGVGVSSSVSLVAPDFWVGQSGNYSGLPSYKSFLAGIAFTANDAGDYELRLYPIKETAAALAYNPGSAEWYTTNLGFYGASFGIGRLPDLVATGGSAGSGLTDRNIVPIAAWRYGTSDRAYYTDTYTSGFVLNRAALTAFQAPILLPVYPDTVQPVMASDAELSGASQPRRHVEETGLHVMSDRVLAPYYRLTEDGAEVQGRYYWEVTVGASSSSGHRIGIATDASMTVAYDGLVSATSPGLVVRGDGNVYVNNVLVAATGGWALHTVWGFAIDIAGNAAAIYKDGALVWSGAIAAVTGITQAHFRAFGGLEDMGGGAGISICKMAFNFTGPFAYAAPAGYSAFDPFNDAS